MAAPKGAALPELGLNDRRLAVEILRLIDRRLDLAIRGRLTAHRYGVVDGVPDTVHRTVAVRVYGLPNPSPGFHYGSGLAPRDGDHVRVYLDPRGDKWIDDILGRDVVSEIIDVVTPPTVQPDRAQGATARIPVLLGGGAPLPLRAQRAGDNFVPAPADGVELYWWAAERTFMAWPSTPAGWDIVASCQIGPEPYHTARLFHRTALGESGIYGPVSTGGNLIIELPAGTTHDAPVHLDSQTGSGNVTAGGPVTPSGSDAVVFGFGCYGGFFASGGVTPGSGVVELLDVDVPGGNSPTAWVGYKSVPVATSTTIDAVMGNGNVGWAGVTVAFLRPGSLIFEPAPEAIDVDDATYHVLSPTGTEQPEAMRLDLHAPYRVVRARIVVGCATAGAKSYQLRGATQGDFSDEVTLATMAFTAAGAYAPAVLTPVWPSTTPYQFYRLVGPAESRRVFTLELYETTAGETPVTDPTTGLGAEIDAALAAVLAAVVTDHGGLTGLGDDDHPQYTTAGELAAYAQPLDSDLTAFAALAIAADTLPYGTGSHTLGLTGLSAFIRTLLDDTDAATARATLGVSAVGALDDLSDVVITAAADGQILRLVGGVWVNTALPQPLVEDDGAGSFAFVFEANGEVIWE
jgi:hypothetical protein